MAKEEIIQSAQQMDLIYSQSGTLYDLIPLAAIPTSVLERPSKGPHADGMIGSIRQIDQLTQQMGQASVQNSQPIAVQENQQPANPTQTLEILIVQDTDQK